MPWDTKPHPGFSQRLKEFPVKPSLTTLRGRESKNINKYTRVVLNSFTRKRTSSLNKKFTFAKLSPYPCLTLAVHQASMEQDLGQMSHRNFSVVVAAQCCTFRFDVFAWYFGPCSPSSASSDTSTLKLHYSCKEAVASPQFRPPSLQMKAVFRQGFSKTFAKLSRKINLYNRWEEQKIHKSCVWGCHGLPSW